MKNNRRIIAGLLVLFLMISPITSLTVFGASFGDELHSDSLYIANKTVLANGVYWNSGANDRITENYIEYQAGGNIIPKISYGNDIYGAASYRAVVAKSESEGDRVVAGLNGDFFHMSNGVPLGMTIKDGFLLTSEGSKNPSIGFYEDGTAIIGRANLNIRVSGDNLAKPVGSIHLNKVVSNSSGLMLYTRDFADDDTNKAPIPTYNIILEVDSGEIAINNKVEARVESVLESEGPTYIPEGRILLSISLNTDYPGTLSNVQTLTPGDHVTIEFNADEEWNDVLYAVGGGDKLVTAGSNVAPTTVDVNPRTAIGIKNDGTLVFYTVDGRQSGYSRGATLKELADRMLELGCVEALNMDGGGSTAIHSIYPGNNIMANVNKPSQGSLRNCANYILLINTADPTGRIANIHPYPYSAQMLPGAELSFDIKATDDYYYPVASPSVDDLSFSAPSELGSFDNKGVFKAGSKSRTGKATIKLDKSVSTTVDISIISNPDKISIINQKDGKSITNITLNAGDIIDLSANAVYKTMPLISQAHCYDWEVEGNIGTIDKNGRFTAGNITSGSGTIRASVGGAKASVTVNIVSVGELLESFEGQNHLLESGPAEEYSVRLNRDLTKVKFGYQSAEINYDFSKTVKNIINLPAKMTFSKSPDTINFWIYGDNSGNTLNILFNTKNGEQEVIATKLDFTGWKMLVLNTPEETTSIKSLMLNATGADKGTIYLDQFVGGVGYYVDQQAPVIELKVTDRNVSAVVRDDIDQELSADNIKLNYDGKALSFSYNKDTKKLTATLPEPDGFMHRLSLTASDLSGNINRSALTIPAGDEMVQPFIDMGNHWADGFTSYLYYQGIIKGVKTDAGFIYLPDNNMTRAEFAVIMTNWLDSEGSDYNDVTLPFEDTSSIPDWALDSAKAMYKMGIIQGVGVEGKTYFKPTSPISREEVMTIIGRTQERGFAEAKLGQFGDSNQVSSWALPYVKTLVEQGVISGYDGKLWPKNPVTRAQVATIITGLN